ncbi:MAG: hypothetical protein P1S46_00730 [bacterium]|nr:hypothetical protein [bacterium]MDT8395514.1 hypothetical protein [bacterium]
MVSDNNRDVFDEATNTGLKLPGNSWGHNGGGHLVVVREGGKVVHTFQPRGKQITFGRSRNNSIVLPHPAFPRQAGEIILGPVPHYREGGNGSGSKALNTMVPGKDYRFGPYSVRLMGPGDILANRAGSGKGVRRSMSTISGFAISGALILVTTICYVLVSHSWNVEPLEAPEAPFQTSRVGQKTNESSNELAGGAALTETVLPVSRDTVKTEDPPFKESNPATRAPSVPLDRGPSGRDQSPRITAAGVNEKADPLSASQGGIKADQFEKIISTVRSLLGRGQINEAVRAVRPIVPFANHAQRVQIIGIMDPPLQEKYKKAYLLKDYERSESVRILNDIVMCRLEFLPAWQKAQTLLDGCRVTSTR